MWAQAPSYLTQFKQQNGHEVFLMLFGLRNELGYLQSSSKNASK